MKGRVFFLSALAVGIAFGAGLAARLLAALIGLITNLAFYGRFSFAFTSPAHNHLGPAVIIVPVIGALIVGIMARYGSPAIRGHGIPEAMEQVLLHRSRVPPRLMFLKPISAAIAIGTGGPFGAEGPIIATGGALGSVVGQFLHISADERKTLLAAGAAAGMAATFGSPVSAVLLAIELLLFEYRARSLIPVSLAASVASLMGITGGGPAFPMPTVVQSSGVALAAYVAIGAVVGLAAVGVVRALDATEEAFERLPIHWMWWPAIGAVAVGVIGWLVPRTLGVGYDNIAGTVTGTLAGRALLVLVVCKLISWVIALSSGTSGGTLAPLFTIGGGLGALLGAGIATIAPALGVDPRIAALVGMAAMFAGASHALLTSVVFAFETTRQPMGLLPLLAGCSAAYLVSLRLLPHSIMTGKLARRGTRVRADLATDPLEHILVRDIAEANLAALGADTSTEETSDGVVTIFDTDTARDAADAMVREGLERLAVVTRSAPTRIIGFVSRSDIVDAYVHRLAVDEQAEQHLSLRFTRTTTAT